VSYQAVAECALSRAELSHLLNVAGTAIRPEVKIDGRLVRERGSDFSALGKLRE
jgi:hypothetical protein